MFEIPPGHYIEPGIHWMADGSAITYVVTHGGVDNIWSQPTDRTPPFQLTDFTSRKIFAFDWSRDGKYLVCTRGVFDNDVVMIKNFR